MWTLHEQDRWEHGQDMDMTGHEQNMDRTWTGHEQNMDRTWKGIKEFIAFNHIWWIIGKAQSKEIAQYVVVVWIITVVLSHS